MASRKPIDDLNQERARLSSRPYTSTLKTFIADPDEREAIENYVNGTMDHYTKVDMNHSTMVKSMRFCDLELFTEAMRDTLKDIIEQMRADLRFEGLRKKYPELKERPATQSALFDLLQDLDNLSEVSLGYIQGCNCDCHPTKKGNYL